MLNSFIFIAPAGSWGCIEFHWEEPLDKPILIYHYRMQFESYTAVYFWQNLS